MPIPDYIIQNDFLINLGDDFVAVDLAGHIVGRAATRDALLRAHAEGSVKIYSATDFADAPEEALPLRADDVVTIAASDVTTVTMDDVVVSDTDAPKKPRKKSA